MDRLKTETSQAHRATESVPFNDLLISGKLPLHRYRAHLACLSEIHDTLEKALSTSTHSAIRSVWRDDLAKAPLLRLDLEFFKRVFGHVELDAATRRATADGVSAINRFAESVPVSLLGMLYVLEGSTLGGAILRKHISAAFGLERDGLAYYTPYGNLVMPHWQQFKARMNAIDLNAEERDAVVGAARTMFACISSILLAIVAEPSR